MNHEKYHLFAAILIAFTCLQSLL